MWSDSTPGNIEILYRRSTNAGATFSSAVNLSNNAGSSSSPDVAVSGSNVYVVWHDITPANNEIFYRRSINGGTSFGATDNLSNNAGSSASSSVAASGNNVYVMWIDNTPGNNEILFRSSANAGATFGNTLNLSNSGGNSQTAAMAASGTNVYVLWDDNTLGTIEVLSRRSTDSGARFGDPINLSANTFGGAGGINPSIALS